MKSALSVACPLARCGAPPGQPCADLRLADGTPARHPHADRIAVARPSAADRTLADLRAGLARLDTAERWRARVTALIEQLRRTHPLLGTPAGQAARDAVIDALLDAARES